MHPETLHQYERVKNAGNNKELLRLLACPHHFHINKPFVDAVEAIGRHEKEKSNGGLSFPITSRIMAPELVLTVDNGDMTEVLILRQQGDAVVVIGVSASGTGCQGAYTPGTKAIHCGADNVLRPSKMLAVAFIISLINEPRIVELEPVSGLLWSRQLRKSIASVTGKAAQAFTTVRWAIGSTVCAKGPITTEGHPKALHWCRAHWRKAKEGDPKAEWINIPRKGGWGWYCWAKDCWKGDPKYGLKLQRHEPHLADDPRSKHIGHARAIPDATRWAAMGSAQRQSLVAAGFAPTASLN